MLRNKEKGFSLVDLILLVLIICAIVVVCFMLTSDKSLSEISQVNTIIDLVTSNTTNNKPNKEIVSNVTLANDILEQNFSSSQSYNNQQQNLQALNYFFYNQLNENEKGMYNRIINNIQAFKSGSDEIEIATSKENVNLKFQSCWDAFCLDRPDIFYIDTKKVSFLTQTTSSMWDGVKVKYILKPQGNGSYYLSCWSSESEIDSAMNEIEAVANEVIDKSTNYPSMYDKVKYIHDFIIENAEYNQNKGINDADIYGNLVKKTSVCEGYAKAFKYLLDKLNIPCIIVCGNGIADDGHSEFHAWNYVQMDDANWYAVDTTWDDPIVIGNGKLSEKSKHKYFLVGSNNFSDTHQEDGDVSGTGQNFIYPKLSATNYN